MSERFGQDLLLVEKLAAGGMAEVYRAKQLGVGGFEKTIALKRILPNFAQNEEFKFMFRQEANLCANLNHPNIVQVFSNGEFEGYLYLIMEFVDGRNLRQLLARSDKKKIKIPPEIACFVCLEAAKGLDYAHSFKDERTGQPMEIVHRDISPQNVMLSYDGGVKIVDFGIAKAAAAQAENTRAGVLKGKFGYMSPEQASGMKIDRRTDVFALGIILFETLTQRRLFTCDDDLRTLNLVKQAKVPRPSKYNPAVGPALDRIVLKALARERAERYATAADLYKDLQLFMNQKYPKFIPTQLSEFLRGVFAEDIEEDRKKREKWAAEAPVRVDPISSAPARDATDRDATRFDDEEVTAISNVGDEKPELPPAFEGGRSEPEPPPTLDLHSATHTDFSGENPVENELPLPAGKVAAPELDQNLFIPQPAKAELPRAATDATRIHAVPLSLPSVEPISQGSPRFSTQIGPPPKKARSKRPLIYGAAAAAILIVVALIGVGGDPADAPVEDSATASVDSSAVEDAVDSELDKDLESVSDVATAKPSTPPANSDSRSETAAPAETEIADEPVVAPKPEPEQPVARPQPPAIVEAPSRPTPRPAPATAEVRELRDAQPAPQAGGRDDLPGRAGQPGFLSLRSTPRATEILINGKIVRTDDGHPRVTPLDRLRLPPGRHVLLLRNPIYGIEHREEIVIESDRLLQRDILIRRRPASSP